MKYRVISRAQATPRDRYSLKPHSRARVARALLLNCWNLVLDMLRKKRSDLKFGVVWKSGEI